MLESRSFIAIPPGATIKEQLNDLGMTQKEFAGRMDMTEKHISRLINGDVHLTPEVAERLEMVLGIPASFWNKLEAIYQEKLVKVKRENELDKEKELAKKYPYKKIAEWQMVPATKKWEEKVINLCKFFGVSSLKLLQNKALIPVACRRLSDTEKSTFIMITLAQYAKIKAKNVAVSPICVDILKEKIAEIRNLTMHSSTNFNVELVNILKSCGIALIYLPKIEGSFLHGITFYDNNKIVIGITMRGKYSDRFWFSLFHEISHIIQGHIYQKEGTSNEDEKQADSMAAELLIPNIKLRQFYQKEDYSMQAIESFSSAIGISSDIVIGRLQHDHKLRQNEFNEHKKKYNDLVS